MADFATTENKQAKNESSAGKRWVDGEYCLHSEDYEHF